MPIVLLFSNWIELNSVLFLLFSILRVDSLRWWWFWWFNISTVSNLIVCLFALEFFVVESEAPFTSGAGNLILISQPLLVYLSLSFSQPQSIGCLWQYVNWVAINTFWKSLIDAMRWTHTEKIVTGMCYEFNYSRKALLFHNRNRFNSVRFSFAFKVNCERECKFKRAIAATAATENE